MTDERLGMAAGAWLRDIDQPARDSRSSVRRAMTQVRTTRQVRRWWPPPMFDRPVSTFSDRELAPVPIPATSGPAPARRFTMFSAVKSIAAAVIVALFGGFLLAGILTTQHGDEVLPAVVTESPSPTTTEELLSGMVTEEVEPGVFRVINDGVRDLTGEPDGVVVGQDGSIWLEHSGDLSRLGIAETHDWQLGEWDGLWDFEIAHDGTVWAVAVNDEGPALRSFDGETWTSHRAVEDSSTHPGDVEVASDGVVWAALGDGSFGYLEADGSTWQTVETPTTRPATVGTGSIPAAEQDDQNGLFRQDIWEFGFIATESDVWTPYFGGVSHYADGEWEHTAYGDPDTGVLPDGVFWGVGQAADGDRVLYRHDGTGWGQWSLKEHDLLPDGWLVGPHAVAPDGSFWAGWSVRGSRCLGVNRFDGRTWVRYLPASCVDDIDIAADGSVWLLADNDLYVITPGAREAEAIEPLSVEEANDAEQAAITTEELLSGMVTEEVEPGVFRVINDGVRDLSYPLGGWGYSGFVVDVTSDGGVWMSVDEGDHDLFRLGEEPVFEDPWDQLRSREVAPDGSFWAIGDDTDGRSGIFSFDGERWTERATTTGHLSALAVGPDGTVWVLAMDGDKYGTVLLRLEDDGSLMTIEDWSDVYDGGANWLQLAVSPDGDVWLVGGSTQGSELLLRFDGEGWEAIAGPEGWRPGELGRYVDVDADGALWVKANAAVGLARFDDPGWTMSMEADGVEPWSEASYFDTDLLNIAADGSVWLLSSPTGPLGQGCGGVSHYDGTRWTSYLVETCVHDFAIAPDGSVWLGANDDDSLVVDNAVPLHLYVITPEAVAATEQ